MRWEGWRQGPPGPPLPRRAQIADVAGALKNADQNMAEGKGDVRVGPTRAPERALSAGR
ncbi:hypothetical protein SLNWT_5038 [Streptomyces albus]|uniref:Uncharacterized protein n=1 Tax=Streptomyces albus (strain ATCC 21838 / DSM 41398 / FERM P-419 / JCM 4703 / NBRC 107858) TaxID=1081613 RepID=A0A0B5EUI0_STRA4|nr:hypothetical protein SLNWT_5038 [Streptomyces albus]AOU79718.1 hypothetical protein SLNHY_5027 [Streptomyces albus]AYN35442.1 hypothetical protein DUI70_4944 [Streptomyces albus]